MTAVQQNISLIVLKCFLSIRRSKTEKITVFFYEILSPAGVRSSGIGFGSTGEEDEGSVSVESGIDAFISHTENLSGRMEEQGRKLPGILLSSLEGIRGEILTPESVRESLDKGGNKTLEERIREEVASRIGYRATAYIQAERKSPAELAELLGSDFSAEISAGDGRDGSAGEINFLIPCSPAIDPVKGIPAAALEEGESIVVHLPSGESPLREKLRTADPAFDGALRGEVLSIHRDREGGFTVLLRLSEEFNGVITLEGNTKLRRALAEPSSVPSCAGSSPGETPGEEKDDALPPSVLLLLAGSCAVLLTLLLMFRIFR